LLETSLDLRPASVAIAAVAMSAFKRWLWTTSAQRAERKIPASRVRPTYPAPASRISGRASPCPSEEHAKGVPARGLAADLGEQVDLGAADVERRDDVEDPHATSR
jgi:hypothetical protein